MKEAGRLYSRYNVASGLSLLSQETHFECRRSAKQKRIVSELRGLRWIILFALPLRGVPYEFIQQLPKEAGMKNEMEMEGSS